MLFFGRIFFRLNSRGMELVFSITELIALRMRSPWLWPQAIFKRTALGREQAELLKVIHKFTREVDTFEHHRVTVEPFRL